MDAFLTPCPSNVDQRIIRIEQLPLPSFFFFLQWLIVALFHSCSALIRNAFLIPPLSSHAPFSKTSTHLSPRIGFFFRNASASLLVPFHCPPFMFPPIFLVVDFLCENFPSSFSSSSIACRNFPLFSRLFQSLPLLYRRFLFASEWHHLFLMNPQLFSPSPPVKLQSFFLLFEIRSPFLLLSPCFEYSKFSARATLLFGALISSSFF